MRRDRCALSRFKIVGHITLTVLFLLLLQSQRIFGQVDEGSITGTVQDPSGAVIPNAQVTLLNTDQGITLNHHDECIRCIHFLAGPNRALLHHRECPGFHHHYPNQLAGKCRSGLAGERATETRRYLANR